MASKNYINVSRRAVYLALITFLCLNLISVTPFFYVEHPIDVLTESAYFAVLVYIRAAISRSITSTRSITVGVNLILFVALYDVLTEVDWLADWSNRHEVLDNIIEQGGMLVAVASIAFGIDRLIKAKDHEIHRDSLTGLYNRRYLERFSQEQLNL
ncbi:hypothetical protein [Vibrio vulnificus]|uniref:hypothetical protein n=1 Tax=Vibrio vulnificus TaxID=672 RepID=UPI001FAF4756|nr:hypothetical protein [Vibrio vulnificus]MCJ0804184.1 hypothetical protein [Vibrio vulnificus]